MVSHGFYTRGGGRTARAKREPPPPPGGSVLYKKERALAATVHSIVGSRRVHIDTSALADSSIDRIQFNIKNLAVGSRKLPSFAEVDE